MDRGGAASGPRRGWVLLAGLLVGASLAAIHALSADPSPPAGAHATLAPAGADSETVWVVAPGETLWSIARQVAPRKDPREVVEALRRVNGLQSPVVRVGQELRLPSAR